MGASGRQRALSVYEWEVIIPQYEELWTSLEELRQEKYSEIKRLAHPWPSRMDPFYAFDDYPTSSLTSGTILALVDSNSQDALDRLRNYKNLAMVNYAKSIIPSIDEITEIINKLETGPEAAEELVKHLPKNRQGFVFRSFLWLLKLNILKVYR